MARPAPAVLILALLAQPAVALTCARPDVAASMLRAQEAAETYAVLHGTLAFDEAAMPPPVSERSPPDPAPVPARFEGLAFGAGGWAPLAADVTILPTCAGPWCGYIPSGEDWLLIARVGADGTHAVEAAPCGGWAFMDPDAAMLEIARACATGGACEPARPY